MRSIRYAALGAVLAVAAALAPAMPAGATHGGDTVVNVGSVPPPPFSQNKQNEPAVAIDAHAPNVVAAGSNDEIDEELCNAGDPTTCPFTDGVGTSGIYFSFDSGDTWTQPTYTGYTARGCTGPAECQPTVGPIGTLPKYFENGLVSDGDPGLTFGPRPDAQGNFDWANGSRLYYSNLTSNFPGEKAFKGFEAIGVSRIDGQPTLTPAIVANAANWKAPVLASRQNSSLFADKEQIWADNASSSPFFGNVYVCWGAFRGVPGRSQSLVVSRSTDGGDTWNQKQVTSASNNQQHFGRSGCTVRTDSDGNVYMFYEEFGKFATQGQQGTIMMVKSTDGGVRWGRPQKVADVVEAGVFDPVLGRPVMDGIAGFRVDLSGSPSADIANGAPDGSDATDEIVIAWVDARDGLNDEHAMFTYSTNGGGSWAPETPVESQANDRPAYVAPAISPDGTDVYVVYDAVRNPFRNNTSDPRSLQGVVLHSDIGGSGAPAGFAEIHRGVAGDPRGSSQNGLTAEFLGDYVYAAASRGYGVAVWNDVRNAADCPAIDAWRESLYTGANVPRPAPNSDCPATFGNSDIFGGSFGDPTP
jgi:hypothetical protein